MNLAVPGADSRKVLSRWLSPTLVDHQSMPLGRALVGIPAAVWTLALVFVMRGVAVLASFLTAPEGMQTTMDRLPIGLFCIVVGLVMFSRRWVAPDWFLQVSVTGHILLVSYLVATASHDSRVPVSLFALMGLSAYAGAWFTARQGALQMAFMAVSSAIGLGLRPDPALLLPVWITAILTGLVLMLLLNILMRHQVQLGNMDPLTGVLSRSGLSMIVDRPAASGKLLQPVAVAVFDLDGFKQINDRQGHAAGDRLLSDVGAHLRKGTRDTDVIARMGGDEFLVILGGTTPVQAAEIVDRLVSTLPAPASYGISVWPDGADFDAAMRAADDAMYAQKLARRQR